MSRPRGTVLRRLELNAFFANDLAAGEMHDGRLMVVCASANEGWMEYDGEVSLLNSDRRTMTRVLADAVRDVMTGRPVDLADFLPPSPFRDYKNDYKFISLYGQLKSNQGARS